MVTARKKPAASLPKPTPASAMPAGAPAAVSLPGASAPVAVSAAAGPGNVVRPTAQTKPPAKAPAKQKQPGSSSPLALAVKAPKPAKVKKPKLVRDSFTIPKAEYSVLAALKQRADKLSRPAKKSELLRAGVKVLAALSDAAFVAALKGVPTIKTGRPKNS